MAVACSTDTSYIWEWIRMKHWYCIYTKFKYEDHIEQRLVTILDIEVLNPKLEVEKMIRGKSKNITKELFLCYIFSRFDLKRYSHMMKYARGIRRILGDESGRPYIADDEILRQIKSRIEDGFVHIKSKGFNRGDRVRSCCKNRAVPDRRG